MTGGRGGGKGDVTEQTTRFVLRVPGDFDFWCTATSHGWCALPPFAHAPGRRELSRVLSLSGGPLVLCRMRECRSGISVHATSPHPLTPAQRGDTASGLRTCLRLDEDFTSFHAEARKHPEYRWIAHRRSGRLLRSPTMFEDALKMICTTNCTWALTTLMVTNLVRLAGRMSNGAQAFPDAAAIAGLSEGSLRKEFKTGYRSPYILELAQRVAGGSLDVESWRTSPLPTEDLFQAITRVKGIGPYAAGNLLKLTGRYEHLGLDSWVRGRYFALHRNGRKVKDRTIEHEYEHLGKWRGLFFWLEMTKDWQMGVDAA